MSPITGPLISRFLLYSSCALTFGSCRLHCRPIIGHLSSSVSVLPQALSSFITNILKVEDNISSYNDGVSNLKRL